MICLHCGHLNEAFSTFCEKCQSVLSQRVPPPPLADRYDFIADCAKKVKSMQMSSGEFRDILENFMRTLKKVQDDVEKMEIPQDMEAETKDEMNMGTAGVKLYMEAILELHKFLDTRQDIYLQRGLAMANDANNRLNEALRLNFEGFTNIQETAEEFLRTQSQI